MHPYIGNVCEAGYYNHMGALGSLFLSFFFFFLSFSRDEVEWIKIGLFNNPVYRQNGNKYYSKEEKEEEEEEAEEEPEEQQL